MCTEHDAETVGKANGKYKVKPTIDELAAELELARETIAAAKEVLEQAACGGVGPGGPTLEEMRIAWEAGGVVEGLAYYDTCQHAWRVLDGASASGEWREKYGGGA